MPATPAELGPDSEPLPHPTPISFGETWVYELTFPGDPRGPGIARTAVRTVLRAHRLGELVDRAELLTSELATNSVQHTKGPVSVRMQWRCPVLRISVWDPSPDLPRLPRALTAGGKRDDGESPTTTVDPLADRGRGLLLLDTVADRWGGCAIGPGPLGPGGKTIWFEVALDDGHPASLSLAA